MVSIAAHGLLSGIEFGEPLEFKSLRVVPLVGPSHEDPSYRLFGPNVAEDVKVDEVNDAGSVPNLRVTNRLTASALAWGEADAQTIVHLQAFPRESRRARMEVHTAEPASHTVERRAGRSAGRRCPTCGFLYGLVVTPQGDYCNHCGYAQGIKGTD